MNATRKGWWFFAAFNLLLGNSLASAFTVDQVLFNLKQQEEKLKAVQFDFNQDINFTTTQQEVRSEGRAVFQKPNMLTVIQHKPQNQITVTNGRQTWVYNPTLHQVWVGKGKKSLADLLPKGMIPFQNVAEELQSRYDLTVLKSTPNKAEVHIGAVPKDEAQGYNLELVFSTETWLPTQTVYVSSTAKVVTTILNCQLNPALPATTFHFTPPPGTDVIPF